MSKKKPVALLSAYTKDEHLTYFARELRRMGWKLLSSGGTHKFLKDNGIPSKDVASIVGEPILGHRVVTLGREVYAGILARRGNEEDAAELERIGMDPISLVYVDLYPLAEEIANPGSTYKSVVEKIDIGGPTLLRAAAKGNGLVLCGPSQFDRVLAVLDMPADPNPFRNARFEQGFLHQLCAEAEKKVADYAAIAAQFYQDVADKKWDRY